MVVIGHFLATSSPPLRPQWRTQKRSYTMSVETKIPMTAGSSVKRFGGRGGGSSRSEDVTSHVFVGHSRGTGRPSDRRPSFGSNRTSLCRRGEGAAWLLSGRRSTHLSGLSCPPLLALFLLTLMVCRPCHGHDPEIFDVEDEDGKILFLSSLFYIESKKPSYTCR